MVVVHSLSIEAQLIAVKRKFHKGKQYLIQIYSYSFFFKFRNLLFFTNKLSIL